MVCLGRPWQAKSGLTQLACERVRGLGRTGLHSSHEPSWPSPLAEEFADSAMVLGRCVSLS